MYSLLGTLCSVLLHQREACRSLPKTSSRVWVHQILTALHQSTFSSLQPLFHFFLFSHLHLHQRTGVCWVARMHFMLQMQRREKRGLPLKSAGQLWWHGNHRMLAGSSWRSLHSHFLLSSSLLPSDLGQNTICCCYNTSYIVERSHWDWNTIHTPRIVATYVNCPIGSRINLQLQKTFISALGPLRYRITKEEGTWSWLFD